MDYTGHELIACNLWHVHVGEHGNRLTVIKAEKHDKLNNDTCIHKQVKTISIHTCDDMIIHNVKSNGISNEHSIISYVTVFGMQRTVFNPNPLLWLSHVGSLQAISHADFGLANSVRMLQGQ